jgi:hypothetical protein
MIWGTEMVPTYLRVLGKFIIPKLSEMNVQTAKVEMSIPMECVCLYIYIYIYMLFSKFAYIYGVDNHLLQIRKNVFMSFVLPVL